MKKSLQLLGIMMLLLLSTITLAAKIKLPKPDTHEFTLDNGLKLIVRQDDRAPVAVSFVWYKVGSADETGGITGISHVVEHMMFKGTSKHPGTEFSRIIAENGGKENAFTSRDFTGYFQKIAADRVNTCLELEADRMQNLSLPEAEYQKELEVVKEERRMRVDDNPNALTYERFNAAANLAHPYHHMTIGWMNDLNNMTISDVKQWYRQWYAPNNAIVVVVGNVDPKKVYQQVKDRFGKIPRKELPQTKPYREPKPLGQRQVTVKAPAQLPYILMGFNVPSIVTASDKQDAYTLEVISAILSAGNSSRFSKELIRGSQIASSVDSDYEMYSRYDSLFTIDGIPSRGRNTKELQTEILKQIKRLQTATVTQKELKRVKAQVLANYIYQMDSLHGQAMQIGMLETIGLSWREAANYVKNIEAITPKQIKAIANKYLVPERMTVANLKPLPMQQQPTKPVTQSGGRHV